MAAEYLLDAAALLLVAFVGFASHRASLCTVRAVHEVLSVRRARVLTSFGKAALWAAVVYGTVLLLAPSAFRGFLTYDPRALGLFGGFLFGVGAAINGGCSLSTLQRLADGDPRMLLSLAGLAAGILLWSAADAALGASRAVPTQVVWERIGDGAPVVLALLWLLAAWELTRLWRSRPRGLAPWHLPGVTDYRLSTSALVIGVSGGLLYGLLGPWTYSNYLRTAVESAYRGGTGPGLFQAWLLAALFLGMVASALQRGSFLRRAPGTRGGWLQNFAGGTVMGLGAAAVPGGNDTLILTAIPTLSGWALATYLALLAGVASVLVVKRAMAGAMDGGADCETCDGAGMPERAGAEPERVS